MPGPYTRIVMSVRLPWYLTLLVSTAGVAAAGFLVIASFGQHLAEPAAVIGAARSRPAPVAPTIPTLSGAACANALVISTPFPVLRTKKKGPQPGGRGPSNMSQELR